MAYIEIDGLTINLASSINFYDMQGDTASVDLLGDNTQLLDISVGHDNLKIRANFITLLDIMNAIAAANSFKVVPIVPKAQIKDAVNHSEYFDDAGKYHVNKPNLTPKKKAVSRKTYLKQTGLLDFTAAKTVGDK